MPAEARYCTTEDGVRIAFCVQGEGEPVIVAPYFFNSFSSFDDLPLTQAFVDKLAEGRQLLHYDRRGTGLSQRDATDVDPVVAARDIDAVAKACGLKRFSLIGWATESPIVIAYAAAHPDMVERLIVYAGFANIDVAHPRENRESLAALCRSNWDLASQLMADMSARVVAPEFAFQMAAAARSSVSGQLVADVITAKLDVEELAATVQCPTLIVHRRGDTSFRFQAAQELASIIPDSRLAPLNGEESYFALGDTEALFRAMDRFLRDGDGPDAPRAASPEASAFRAILFTDLVGHTEMMSRLGDDAGREVLREHERITREVLAANGGTEVKTMGDGFMASFGSVTKAVECAIALQLAFSGREGEPLSVRVGINAGEPIEEDGDLFGATVILASRIAAKADGGEILVADTVRGLCSGKGFLFADRGEFVAKGIEEPVRVYEVGWQAS